jgi:DNA polymerase-1
MATNTPLQGTAADMIKKAMLEIDRELTGHGRRWRSLMVLQIHDELLFDAPGAEADRLTEMVRETMESVVKLDVPVVVDVGRGGNWAEAH